MAEQRAVPTDSDLQGGLVPQRLTAKCITLYRSRVGTREHRHRAGFHSAEVTTADFAPDSNDGHFQHQRAVTGSEGDCPSLARFFWANRLLAFAFDRAAGVR